MSFKKNSARECNPVVTGLLPVIFFIVGMVMAHITVYNDNFVVDDDEWFCAKFDNGECHQLNRKPFPQQDKVLKNESR